MAFQEFFKKNFVLVVGITLPVIMMIGFMVIADQTKRSTTPPQYDFIFTGNSYNGKNHGSFTRDFSIKDNKLMVKITKLEQGHHNPNTLYHYEAESRSIREIKFDFPEHIVISDMKKDQVASFELPHFKNQVLNIDVQSPDGYTFVQRNNYRRGFIINEFFGSSRNRHNVVTLEKDARRFKIKVPQNNIYNREFIGWIEK